MISPGAVIISVLPVYLLIFTGALLRKARILKAEHDDGVMRVIYNVLYPCFILDKILGHEVLRSGPTIAWGMGLGFTIPLLGVGLGWCVARLFGFQRGTGLRTFAIASGIQNFGFTAIPVVQILWGGGALAVMFIHNIGVEIAIWTVCVMIMSGDRGFTLKKLLNGPVVAVATGLLLVALGLDTKITGPAREAMAMLGIGSFPLAILITGASMADLIASERPSLKMITASVVVRIILAPLLILAAAKFLPIPSELRQVLVVQAAMPAALSTVLLARLYNGRPAVAVQVIIATTIVSIGSLPWIITWGCQWVGLKPLLP
ncbi:AEC family transporter [Luteolibacter sp. SL250]|uniref:AEC family transporter n=1 Tax=Luteolibacter sp. SL250 TaxID=2995170 RepID=UPI0022721B84|nr:AEC family transporter [Luteolibacter sp. SL250]WAC21274.1 AEC family transporter [Luteolibacter sp. SL250]